MKTGRLRIGVLLAGPALAMAWVAPEGTLSQARSERGRWSVFEIMAQVSRLEAAELWPGFDPAAVPTALFDGESTYLFGYGHPLAGFRRVRDPIDCLMYEGPYYPLVGNRRVEIEGVWVAACAPQHIINKRGRWPTLAEAAAAVLHEKFHVFQALRHPAWKPNDGLLLRYPLDTAAALASRRMEIECLRRAASAGTDEDACGWALAAIALRRERLARLPRECAVYERNLQLLEGLAQYVQACASDRPDVDPGLGTWFAPAAVRELGYVEGWRFACLLDRFVPRWKEDLETEGFDSLEARLEGALGGRGLERELSGDERRAFQDEAARDWAKHAEERYMLLRRFHDPQSVRIEVIAQGEPFYFETFDPCSVEALDEASIVHWRGITARIGKGFVDVAGRPCLAIRDADGAVRRMIATDFTKRPSFGFIGRAQFARTGRLSFGFEGLTVRVDDGFLSRRDDTLVIFVR